MVTFKSDLCLLLFKSQIYGIVMVKQMDLGSFFCLLLYRHVRDFYVDVTAMMVKKFPFRDQTLKSLGFVNSRVKDTVLVDSGEFFPTLYLTQNNNNY